jgi:hypothetical protein
MIHRIFNLHNSTGHAVKHLIGIYIFIHSFFLLPSRSYAQESIKVEDVRFEVLRYSQETLNHIDSLGKVGSWLSAYWHSFLDWNGDTKKDMIYSLVEYIDESGGYFRTNEHIIGLFHQGENYIFYEDHNYMMYVDGGMDDYSRSVADFTGDGLLDIYIPPYWHPDPDRINGGSIFINHGSGFNQSNLDSTIINPDHFNIHPGAQTIEWWGQGIALDLSQEGKNNLYISNGCFDYPRESLFRGYDFRDHTFADVVYLPNRGIDLTYTDNKELCWQTTFSYVSILEDTLYSAIWRNIESTGNKYADFKICKWSLPVTPSTEPYECIDIIRDENLYKQRDISDNFSFWIEDLNQDGNLEFILYMYTPSPNITDTEFHSSIHIFDYNGNEITSNWFNNTDYLEKNYSHANGIYVTDLDNDGLADIFPINGFYEGSSYYAFINKGESFTKTKIDFDGTYRNADFMRNGSERGFKIPVDINGDGQKEIFHFRNHTNFNLANLDIVFLEYPASLEIESFETPFKFELYQNYPNPFNPSTQIRFTLPEPQLISIDVHDVNGRKISSLIDNVRYLAGNHQVLFDGSGLSSGIYIYTIITSSGLSITRKLLLMK